MPENGACQLGVVDSRDGLGDGAEEAQGAWGPTSVRLEDEWDDVRLRDVVVLDVAILLHGLHADGVGERVGPGLGMGEAWMGDHDVGDELVTGGLAFSR